MNKIKRYGIVVVHDSDSVTLKIDEAADGKFCKISDIANYLAPLLELLDSNQLQESETRITECGRTELIIPDQGPIEQNSQKPNNSSDSPEQIRSLEKQSTGEKSRQLWPDQDIAFLRSNVGTMSWHELAKALRRNKNTVYAKAFSLGIHKQNARQRRDAIAQMQSLTPDANPQEIGDAEVATLPPHINPFTGIVQGL